MNTDFQAATNFTNRRLTTVKLQFYITISTTSLLNNRLCDLVLYFVADIWHSLSRKIE